MWQNRQRWGGVQEETQKEEWKETVSVWAS